MSDPATGHYQKIMRLKSRIKRRDDEIERLRRALLEIAELNLNDPAALSIFLARSALEGKE